MKQAAELIVEQMLSAEVDERLGRSTYQRLGDQQVGHRNGYKSREDEDRRRKGRISRRCVAHGAAVSLDDLGVAGKRTVALEKLACEMYARGLSARDIEELLGELGEESRRRR